MGNPVVHFEIIGTDPERLRRFYDDLFGWKTNDAPVAKEVSEAGKYGFLEPQGDAPVAGGIGGGNGYKPHALFYVGVEDVSVAITKAETLGGKRVMGPAKRPDGKIVVAQITDPEGNLIGLAGPK